MLRLSLARTYRSQYKQLIQASPELQLAIDQAVDRFRKNPADTRLAVHAVFEYAAQTTVRFLNIGTHSQIYPGYRIPTTSMLNDA